MKISLRNESWQQKKTAARLFVHLSVCCVFSQTRGLAWNRFLEQSKDLCDIHASSLEIYPAEGGIFPTLHSVEEAQGRVLHMRQMNFFNSVNPEEFLYECRNRKVGKYSTKLRMDKLKISHSSLSSDTLLVVDYFALAEHQRYPTGAVNLAQYISLQKELLSLTFT